MPSSSNLENDVINEKIKSNQAISIEKKSLTYKDWKTLKDKQNQTNGKSENNGISNSTNKNNIIASTNKKIIEPRVPFVQEVSNFFADKIGLSGVMPPNHFKAISNSNNMFSTCGSSFRTVNNGFNNCPNSNINRANYISCINYNYRFNNFNGSNNFTNGRNRFNGPIVDNFHFPDSFFASDGVYRQKDLLQQPLLNPFRNDRKADQLLREFDKSRYTKDGKKSKKVNQKPIKPKDSTSFPNDHQTVSVAGRKPNEPKVYVPNPKAKIDGKPFIPKPKVPEPNLEITKEEKKQQWKHYREAMKPFKNREFYNAKRVVQRLGKKNPSELDEKQVIRLSKAQEIITAYKARLSAKYPNYIKAGDSTDETGELYVLKKSPLKDVDFPKTTKPFPISGNFGGLPDFESGRKIVGGYSNFVAGGLLEGVVQRLSTR